MPYDVTYVERGLLLKFCENLTIGDIINANAYIYGLSESDSHRFRIIDLSESDLREITEAENELVGFFDNAAYKSNPNLKVAFIVESTSLNTVKNCMDNANVKTQSWKFQLFETYNEAYDWAIR
jgi:hypothetical protein